MPMMTLAPIGMLSLAVGPFSTTLQRKVAWRFCASRGMSIEPMRSALGRSSRTRSNSGLMVIYMNRLYILSTADR